MRRFASNITLKSLPIPLLIASLASMGAYAATSSIQSWQLVNSSDGSAPEARHESGAVNVNGKLYLLGGRQMRLIQYFDSANSTWTTLGTTPLELHHFQPVAIGNTIYVVGAFTCCYPMETLVADVHAYDTQTNTWSIAGSMPASRLRGSAAAVVRNNKIYILGGNTKGHSGGAVAWFDEFDPATGQWKTLPDAPAARDHFSAVLVNDYLVAAGGRQTSLPNPFKNAVVQTDVYDFVEGEWTTAGAIPTARAGAVAIAAGDEVIVAGGEINTETDSLDSVEAFNVYSRQWRVLQSLQMGRHSGGGAVVGNNFHMTAGSLKTGGAPETNSHEMLIIDLNKSLDFDADGLSNTVERQQHGTNPGLADSDFDGLNDKAEIEQHLTDPNKSDTDNDGLSDGDEITDWSTDPTLADTDNDGLTDFDEITTHITNPLVADTDADDLSDSDEVNQYGTDPANSDTDADGVKDGAEVLAGTNPLVSESGEGGSTGGDNNPEENVTNNNTDSGDGNADNGQVDNADSGSGGGGGTAFWLLAAILVGRLSRRH